MIKRPLPLLLLAILIAPQGLAAPPAEGRPRLFISPMGEPFRGGDIPPEQAWFTGADRDHDGKLSLTEFTLDAARFFAILDLDHSGQLSPEEITHYETEIAPEVNGGAFGGGDGGFGGDGGRSRPPGGGGGGHRGGGGPGGFGGGGGGSRRGGGGFGGEHGEGDRFASGGAGQPPVRLEGAGRYGYIATPEPVSSADTDLSGIVSRAEFLGAATRRFAMLDANQDGMLSPNELPRLAGRHQGGRGGKRRLPEDRLPLPPAPDGPAA